MLALPAELLDQQLHERTRSYFFGNMAVVDDTAKVQAFLDAGGGGQIPVEWGNELIVRGTLHMPPYSRLSGGVFSANGEKYGLKLTGSGPYLISNNLISSGNVGGIHIQGGQNITIAHNVIKGRSDNYSGSGSIWAYEHDPSSGA